MMVLGAPGRDGRTCQIQLPAGSRIAAVFPDPDGGADDVRDLTDRAADLLALGCRLTQHHESQPADAVRIGEVVCDRPDDLRAVCLPPAAEVPVEMTWVEVQPLLERAVAHLIAAGAQQH